MYGIFGGLLEFACQKIPQQHLRVLCHIFSFSLSAACLPSYVPNVSLIHCMSRYSLIFFQFPLMRRMCSVKCSSVVLIIISELDTCCATLILLFHTGFNDTIRLYTDQIIFFPVINWKICKGGCLSLRATTGFEGISPHVYNREVGLSWTFVVRIRPQNARRTCKNCLTTSVPESVWKSSYSAPSGWCWLHRLAYIGTASVSTPQSFYCHDLAVSASGTLPSVPFVRSSIATSSYVTDLKNLYRNPINLQACGMIPLC